MNDIPDPKNPKATWTWQVGPAFIGIIIQIIVGVFMLGGIWYRLDTSFSKIDTLTTKLDVVQQATDAKLNRFEVFMAKVSASYDSIKDRLTRVENKMDASQPNGSKP